MSINFEINNRVNKIWTEIEKEAPGDTRFSEVPDLLAVINDVIRILEVRIPIDVPYKELEPPGIIVHEGPGIYALLDSSWDSGSHWCPSILWIGQSDHVKRRVGQWKSKEIILFDGIRTVFIEHEYMRRFIERELIHWFRKPESGHSHSLQNLR
ncbi:MAG TPA: hypothetical protein VN957_18545 [Chthoniobacterales bacterium]|nr:hypothetical protein [Chthoniobacterales bacterium]